MEEKEERWSERESLRSESASGKPQTYMNLSGESLRELVNYYKIDEEHELLVIYDDISLDVGQLRIRKKGSAGGITESRISLPIWERMYFRESRSG